jgi:hypothetical protein
LLVVLCLVASPVDAAAQEAPAAVAGGGGITGFVLDESGFPRRGVAVRITPQDRANPTLIAISGADGRYAFAGVAPGQYTADIVGDPYSPSGRMITAVAGRDVTQHLVSRIGSRRIFQLLLLAIALFGIGLLLFRRHHIVLTSHSLLDAQLDNLKVRIRLEADAGHAAEIGELTRRVDEIRQKALHESGRLEWLFWSRGREISAWMQLHEVERQLIAFLVPEARVVERAVRAEAELRAIRSDAAVVLAARLRNTLLQILTITDGADEHVPGHLLEHLKQQLAEGLTIIYDNGDTEFSKLMEWHNKAMWLVYLSLLSILFVSLVFHHEELFLLGALGGLMSRMARSLWREDVPNDYGASWTTLFLSPLLGAIAGWVGVALIIWLTETGVLGDAAFGELDWNAPPDAVLIAVAFFLGFSERFFTSLLRKADAHAEDVLKKDHPAPPTPPSLVRAPAPDGGTPAGQASTPAMRTIDRIMRELDVQRGERVGFIGDAASEARSKLVAAAGADNVVDMAPDTIVAKGPLDAVLIEALPTAAALATAALHLEQALRPDGRVVVLGRTPAGLFEADAAKQRAADHPGPALVKEILTTGSGITAQEPPTQIGGTDPVEWLAAFAKPATGGGDR